ncbi:MAG: GIY-YIG nuclease family protein [Candidatus Levybacteria bacterium]|nr:GIY-YIG nuclease family protein [Candidatus Levybacteria bacterium]
MACYVYMLKCADGTYYIGKTQDLEKRLKAHNGEISGGAKYTRGRRPVRLVYSEELNSTSEALKREFELKKLTKPQKLKLFFP